MYSWTDDTDDDYQKWAAGEPSDIDDVRNCVKMGYGVEYMWMDATCTEELPFVCQYSKLMLHPRVETSTDCATRVPDIHYPTGTWVLVTVNLVSD